MITLLRGGWAAVWDGSQHCIVERGEVAFEENKILYAGPKFDGQADVVIDKPDWFLCPGFINLHGHVGVDPVAPLVDGGPSNHFAPSEAFVQNAPLNMWPTLTPEEQQLSGEICLVQMVRTGTTTVVDAHGYGAVWWQGNPPTDEALLAETIGRVGCRGYLGLGFRSARSYQDKAGNPRQHWDEEMGYRGLEQGVRFAFEHRGRFDGRVQTLLTPHAVEKFTPDLLKATLTEARAAELPIEIHVAQSLHEVEVVHERYGDSPIGFLNSLGFLGPDIILGHCIYITDHPVVGGDSDRDLKLIADAGSSVAHAPLVFARQHGTALHTLPRYLDYGINVGIGCDTWPGDIIGEMHLAWLMGKHANQTADRPTCMEVFTAATVGSANALRRSDLGRLAAGAKADIVCVDLAGYHFGPVLDPVRALVSFGTGQDVDTVYVDGAVIVEDGNVLNADERTLRSAAGTILDKLHAVAAERDAVGRTRESILGW